MRLQRVHTVSVMVFGWFPLGGCSKDDARMGMLGVCMLPSSEA